MEEISPALLLPDLPPAALAGIDLLSFTIAPAFRGVKGIPPGPHFFFTAPHSTLAVRHGSWFWIDRTASKAAPLAVAAPNGSIHGDTGAVQLVVKKWDATTETLLPEQDAIKLLSHRANLGKIWRTGMTPYRQRASSGIDSAQDGISAEANLYTDADGDPTGWKALSSAIDRPLLGRVLSQADNEWHITSYSDLAGGTDTLPDLDLANGVLKGYELERPLALIRVNLRQTWPDGATGRERTEKARDRSWYLNDLARRYGGSGPESDLTVVLAELQFAFLMALTLNNYACLEHWRTLLRLVLTCRTAVTTAPQFFSAFLSALQVQISRLGADDSSESMQSQSASADVTASSEFQRKAKQLEDQTEEELLRYDLPVRSRKSGGSANGPAARRRASMVAEGEAEAARDDSGDKEQRANSVRQAIESDELRQLFLEDDEGGDDGSANGSSSFLRILLVSFRAGLRDVAATNGIARSSPSTEEGFKGVLAALGRLEGTLFELYGWDFDHAPSPSTHFRYTATGTRGQGDRKAMSIPLPPALASDEVELQGYGEPSLPRRSQDRSSQIAAVSSSWNGATADDRHDDDDYDDDEDGEYAPAVVELSQDQMDALGIKGTPSRQVDDDAGAGPEAQQGNDMMRRLRWGDRGRDGNLAVSQVVVESSSDDDGSIEDDKHLEEEEDDLDDTMDVEDMDTRY